MPSPFPGMNPYFEAPQLGSELHSLLIVAIADALNCPKIVEGVGADNREAQKNAKCSAPEECRKFYGHCDCRTL